MTFMDGLFNEAHSAGRVHERAATTPWKRNLRSKQKVSMKLQFAF